MTAIEPVMSPGFPDGFVWGAGTASYQIEGAVTADGRGPSIWDTFARRPGAVHGGDTGDVATDHYHRWEQDVALMADLGLRHYRFSVAWPRVQPAGSGPVNPAGLDFYQRLVDGLLARGITPTVTLYHWDLPQPLQDAGGWPARDTAYRFAEYAGLVADRLADRVPLWTTLNEPWCAAFLGYASGVHAPGVTDGAQALAAMHHLLLGHGLAVPVLRERLPAGAQVSIVLNPCAVSPASDHPRDVEAAAALDGIQNRVFLDPLFHARYPQDVLERTRHVSDWSFVRPGDLRIIAAPIDVLGVNYYSPTVAAGLPDGDPVTPNGMRSHVGCERVRVVDQDLPRTAMGWGIDPDGLRALLERLHRDLPGVPLLVTENGAAFDDEPVGDGVPDPDRVRYLHGHLTAVRRALAAGVDVRGYFLWSLLDNFEWAEGYAKRFGIVHVDYRTQRRTPKDSALFYSRVIRSNALPPVLDPLPAVPDPRPNGVSDGVC